MGLVLMMPISFVKLKYNLKYFILSTDVCNMIMCTLFGKYKLYQKGQSDSSLEICYEIFNPT